VQLRKEAEKEGIDASFARMVPQGEANPLINVPFSAFQGNLDDQRYINHQHGEVLLIIFQGSIDLLDYMKLKMTQNEAIWGKAVRVVLITHFDYGC
jgi:hypothetical protein